jgi:hypothetical protein
MDVVVDGNLYALVISGHPTEDQLSAAWDEIRLQCAEVSKDGEYRLINSIIREYERLSITYEQVCKVIDILKDTYVEKFAKLLNRWLNTSFKFDIRFPADYDNDLKRAYNNSKGIMLDLKLKKATYDEAIKKQQSEGGKPTREYFISLLTTFEIHWRHAMKDSMTVFEFYDRIARLNKEMEQSKSNKQWQQRKT